MSTNMSSVGSAFWLPLSVTPPSRSLGTNAPAGGAVFKSQGNWLTSSSRAYPEVLRLADYSGAARQVLEKGLPRGCKGSFRVVAVVFVCLFWGAKTGAVCPTNERLPALPGDLMFEGPVHPSRIFVWFSFLASFGRETGLCRRNRTEQNRAGSRVHQIP